jgi:hypothetical protein
MNTNKTFTGIVFVALILSACNLPTAAVVPVTGSVGTISAEETSVESGPSDHLVPVTNPADFFDNDTVRVTNGGVAKLDLLTDQDNNHISIRIFNDTMVGDVKADPSETTDPIVTILLVFGGLTGEVPKNGGVPVQFTTPNGVDIRILGTQFLVSYDPATSTTYIGNFDGFIAYSTPGQSARTINPGQLFEVSSSFEVQELTLNFTRADIDNRTISNRSTLLESVKSYLGPTATPTPTTTPTASPTSSSTPSPTITLTPTKMTLCDKADFVADVTIPDGTPFSPGFQFTKVWRLRNVGTCTWTSGYSLVFYQGEQMGGPTLVNIPSTVAPGQTVDIPVGLVAPALPGSYRGDWMLRNASGASFGAGANGTTPIWVKINVMGLPDLTAMINGTPAEECTIFDTCNVTIAFAIENTGPVAMTSSFQVLIEANETQPSTITVNGLAAGAIQNFSVTLAGLGGVSCFDTVCTARVTVDSSNTILESNEANNVAEATATRIRPGTITGTAFIDTNGNRNRDPGETSRQGFTVTLYDSTGSTNLVSRATDGNGKYTFPNLIPGTYRVRWSEGCVGTPVPHEAIVTVSPSATETQNIPLPNCIF